MNISVKNLNKKFEDFALKDVSIEVPKGKIVGLIGENGAGKTTMIKCILGAMVKDSGDIKLFGKEYDDSLKSDIGVVYDNSFMIETYKVKDINTILKNIYKNWDKKFFFSKLKEYNIPVNKEIRKLSTGMKKKLEIVTALAHHPKILILDEPTSGLDPVIRSEVLDIFQDFVNNSENSILLSTHITSDLEHIADNVIFISKGSIIFDRPLKEIRDDYVVIEPDTKEFDNIDSKDIIRYKKNRLDYQVLIHKKNMKKEYEKYIKHLTTLDDIMLLYIKGEA